MPSFAERLKELRISNKTTQKKIAEYLGIQETSYQHYEYGKREPNHDTTIKLADFFNVSIDYLLGRSDEATPTGNELFAQRLTECRKEKNVTEEDVAEYLGMKVGVYLKYEAAVHSPSIDMLNKLADYFKTSVDYLVGYNPNEYM